jgi:biopolymer transport protein TolR
MAQVQESGNGRSANVDLNIVPFIDLMSVLITFLLITAVWSQVSMIQLGSSIHSQKQENQDPKPPPPLADIPLRLDVKDFGFRLVVGKDRTQIPKVGPDYDKAALLERLKKVKETYPEKVDAVITVDDEIAYEFLVLGMDVLMQSGFSAVSISTLGAE